MDYVYGILIGALAVVVAQGVFKYNLTTTILGIFYKTEDSIKKDINKL